MRRFYTTDRKLSAQKKFPKVSIDGGEVKKLTEKDANPAAVSPDG